MIFLSLPLPSQAEDGGTSRVTARRPPLVVARGGDCRGALAPHSGGFFCCGAGSRCVGFSSHSSQAQ